MIQENLIENIYFYSLIICALVAFLLVIFGGIFTVDGPLDPMLLVPWVAFASLFGYFGEKLFSWSHILILIISSVLATIIVFFLNFYLLVPMKNSEATISISEKAMEGNVAFVVTPIPVQGMGEIQLKSVTGSTSRPAAFYTAQEHERKRGEKVLIIEIRERVCYVVPYAVNTSEKLVLKSLVEIKY